MVCVLDPRALVTTSPSLEEARDPLPYAPATEFIRDIVWLLDELISLAR